MTPDWLLPARSIPVFVTAAVRFRYSEAVDVWGVIKADRNQRFYQRKGYDETIIDLSNPDTFAAARDRLALRMGAPPDHVAVGTKVYAGTCYGRARVIVSAGESYVDDGHHRKSMYPWEKTIELDAWPATRELALALAWQKVTGA